MLRQPLVHLDQTHVNVHVELQGKERECDEKSALHFHSEWNKVPRPALYLLVAVVEDEDDGSREEDGHEADAQTEDPVVNDGDVEVECGEDGAPRHHVEHLLV